MLDVLGGYDTEGREGTNGEEGHNIRVDTEDLFTHPKEDGQSHNDVDGVGLPTLLCSAFNLELQAVAGETVKIEQQGPADDKDDKHKGYHHNHPVEEADIDACILEGTEGNTVGRSTDGGGDTTDVTSDRDGKGKCDASALAIGQCTEYGGKEGEHHGCRGGVADKHREDGCNEHEAEEHHLGTGTERLEHHAGKAHVDTALRSHKSKDETTHEEHDGGVSEGCDDVLVRNQTLKLLHTFGIHFGGSTGIVVDIDEHRNRRIAHGKEHDNDDEY